MQRPGTYLCYTAASNQRFCLKWSEVGPDICIKKKQQQQTTQQRLIYSQCGEPRRAILLNWGLLALSFPSGSAVKESSCSVGVARDMDLIPGSGRSPEEGKGYPTPIFLPGESVGQRILAGYTVHRIAESDTIEVTEHARIVASQCCASFCRYSKANHSYVYIYPLPLDLLPSSPISALQVITEPALLSAMQQLPSSYLFYTQ